MITYVNTVLVGKGTPSIVSTNANITVANAGKYVILDVDRGEYIAHTNTGSANRIKVGLITAKSVKDMNGNSHPVIKWSNIINKHDIKNLNITEPNTATNKEDVVVLDFSKVVSNAVANKLAEGNKRIIVRLTYKDMPTRYRKWTDTYEYVTAAGDNATNIAKGIANIINKDWKRSRVTASYTGAKVTLTAQPYTDDNSVDTINVAGKVRFAANAYYTDPDAAGFASKNKYSINGLEITRTPGVFSTTDAKLVRDREAQAMGYEGILNRGEGTWPIVKPEMNVDLTKNYGGITLEFENMYRAADDIFRKTKQTLEIYDYNFTKDSQIALAISNFVSGAPQAIANIENND